MKCSRFIFLTGSILLAGTLVFIWFRGGFSSFYLSTDLGRDLSEMSNIRNHKIVWLGPRLSPGFPASPIYYYLSFPILYLAKWDANALYVLSTIIALTVLIIFVRMGMKWGLYSLMVALGFGLSPLWKLIAVQPGNGYTYAAWMFFFLITAWFGYPLFVSSVFLGLALSYHPAAIFGLPILFFELRRQGSSLMTWITALLALIFPWTPIILFEIITHGFLIRSFLRQRLPGTDYFQPNLQNIYQLSSFTGLGFYIFVVLLILAGLSADRRLRSWFYINAGAILFFLFSPPVPAHYLLGISATSLFILFMFLSGKYWGRIFIVLTAIFFLVHSLIFTSSSKAGRSISKINGVVEKYISTEKLTPEGKLAVLAILDREVSVPQADDYRYFFRVKGFNVQEVVDYSQADYLLIFIEVPDFDWQNWSSWETEQFGQRSLQKISKIDGITVARYIKKSTLLE